MPRLCWIPVLLVLSTLALGSTTTITDEKLIADIGLTSEIWVDTLGSRNVADVAESGKTFKPIQTSIPNLGIVQKPVWVRINIKNLTFNENWVLQAAYSDMDLVELYTDTGGNWELQELGRSLPLDSRKIVNRNFLFPVSLAFGKEQVLYLRYQNSGEMTLPLRLFSYQQYQRHALGENLVFGVFFGFMLILSLYNLILFVLVREPGYLFYFLYSSLFGLFHFSLYGFAHQYFWPSLTWWAEHHVFFLLGLALVFRTFFTMAVLESGKNAPLYHRAMQGVVWAFGLLAAYLSASAFGILPAERSLTTTGLIQIVGVLFLAFTVINCSLHFRGLRLRFPGARSFFMAWILSVSGLIVYALKSFGYLPVTFLTEYGIILGSVGEMGLLFFGLGRRLRAIKSEALVRAQRQKEAIQAFQEEQIRSMRLELQLLKSQIQPHFMLNSINAAVMWIPEDPQCAQKLLLALSQEWRIMMKLVGKKLIPMEDEIRICRLHLEVMSLRHDKQFSLEVKDILPREGIPPALFHTLVENGLTHGYAGLEKGVFTLSREESGQDISFKLFNDGKSEAKSTHSGGLGLQYVRARLDEAYGRGWTLTSNAVPGGWLSVISVTKGKIAVVEPESLPETSTPEKHSYVKTDSYWNRTLH
jgi:two-component system, sensor histidine kinase LadS